MHPRKFSKRLPNIELFQASEFLCDQVTKRTVHLFGMGKTFNFFKLFFNLTFMCPKSLSLKCDIGPFMSHSQTQDVTTI